MFERIHRNLLLLFTMLIGLVFVTACSKTSTDSPPPLPSSSKSIISFICYKTDNTFLANDIIGIIDNDTIRLLFPNGTPLNNIIPTIVISGVSINPINRSSQNFTGVIHYTITAQDQTTKNYFVSAKTLQSDTKDITSFVFKTANNPSLTADINGTIFADSIAVTVPFGTNLSNLIPTITINGINISPASLIPQNFNNTVLYTVTAQNGSSKIYKVSVATENIDATVYVGSVHTVQGNTGYIYALNATTGTLKWKYILSNNQISSIEFSNGVIFTGMLNKITAIDTITKNIKWQYTTGGSIHSTPTISNGIVYANSDDGYLYAVNAVNGNFIWKYQQGPISSGGNYSSPTVSNGVVYIGSMDGYIHAVNAATGVIIWKRITLNTQGTQSSPSVVNNVLYIGIPFSLFALNATDGSIKWSYNTNSFDMASCPTVVNGTVYIGSSSGKIFAINADNGTLKWSYSTGIDVHASPIIKDGILYVGQYAVNGKLYAIDAVTGTLRWIYQGNDLYFGSPVVFNGNVYIGDRGKYISLDAISGNIKWQFTTTNPQENFISSPTVVDVIGNVHYSSVSGSKD
ncbi:MAG: PQQ-binding-like beta-propeller repeat protein [Chitinophagaceae bacterium]